MTNPEKERFCAFAAALLAPPDEALADDLQQDALQAQLEDYVQAWGGDRQLLSIFSNELGGDDFLFALQAEYSRLFLEPDGKKISLVESTYKVWTVDRDCGMVFAASKGLVMGDHAVHMLNLYQQASLDIPEEFQSMPDHLVLELEFLGLLYQFASNEQVEGFIRDHLDWIPALKEEMETANAHPFYRDGVELIQLFLQHEAKNGVKNGKEG
jgi:TorA maturation chaperone TorD